MTDAKRFSGQVAVVTGAASGLGLGIAKRLASEGARVSLWDCNPATLSAAAATVDGSHTVTVDVVDPAAVERAAQNTLEALGRIDILVASAGITGPNAPSWEYPIAEWRRVMQVNLDGLFYCNRAVVPHFLAAGYGRIVNIASISGKEGNPNACAYSASKAGVIAFTKALGKELAETAIRVNCIAPGAVRTPLFDQMSEAHIQYMLSKIPMKRLGAIEEVAAMACWLASAECTFNSGAVFDLSGGRATY
ncbi:MAG: SDR family oxidoreductase [Acidobacteriota bacterium]|nr:SDR family oxidoreductase [Acidobacteriota bacterium]